MKPSYLPSLRSLQVLESIVRTGSCVQAARELNVTPGAISQQIKVLETHLGCTLFVKSGRNFIVHQELERYFELVKIGFNSLRDAQKLIDLKRSETELTISSLPSLLVRWLNPKLNSYGADNQALRLRFISELDEPDYPLTEATLRLTYGASARRYPHYQRLFTDKYFPVCSPTFLDHHPNARDPESLARLPLIEIDWGLSHTRGANWSDWFAAHGVTLPVQRASIVFSLSDLALDAASSGHGVALAQTAFVEADLASGRLVALSNNALSMTESYYACWNDNLLNSDSAREFLRWITYIGRQQADVANSFPNKLCCADPDILQGAWN